MLKTKKNAVKPVAKDTKQKLTPEQRSQVAKDRWAKRRGDVVKKNAVASAVSFHEQGLNDLKEAITTFSIPASDPDPGVYTVSAETPAIPASVVVTVNTDKFGDHCPACMTGQSLEAGEGTHLEGAIEHPATDVPVPHETVMDNTAMQELKERYDALVESIKADIPAATQLVPVKAPKQKKYTGPKEFSVALKAAESRLAKAIVERAQAAGQLAALQAEIPSLLQIISALKGPQNIPAAPYDLSGSFPGAPAFQPYLDPLASLQGAQPVPPVSRATGGAMQFSPEMVGSLEGPEDDDEDKFITGPAAGGSGWIGG